MEHDALLKKLLQEWLRLRASEVRKGFDLDAHEVCQRFRLTGGEDAVQVDEKICTLLQKQIDQRRAETEWEYAVDAVLDYWEDEYEEGRDHPVEELCRRWPEERLKILNERIAARRTALEAVMDESDEVEGSRGFLQRYAVQKKAATFGVGIRRKKECRDHTVEEVCRSWPKEWFHAERIADRRTSPDA